MNKALKLPLFKCANGYVVKQYLFMYSSSFFFFQWCAYVTNVFLHLH